ncbi:polysaccharide pyruvyl transferase family protein [Faecalicoccus pleomorphus]|uniref:polysaccharide pyruvyl transferase family protein n=1 Tax=Faecalicoccus pleomorphus TaxID=1323 RepID=UPI00189C3785|nr:polysaccharide pyruvyl transferase family protein [Faecalicoccus pleomorphus]MDB7984041.1 polysaccharide pyruvyl transferase family protein [Faecalicoccus pleomorphus]
MSICNKIKNIGIRISQNIDIRVKNLKGGYNSQNDEIIILNTAMYSDNLGDEIIMYYYAKAMEGIISPKKLYNIATHRALSDTDVERLLNCKYAIIIGTNILSPQMELYSGWRFDNRLIRMRNIILVGVGWWGYKKPSIYSKYVYRNILSKNLIHSVRDEQTYNMLKSIGIDNVVNTDCLTMLGLDKSCVNIPEQKSESVLFTLTSILGRVDNDKNLLKILRRNYNQLYYFPQGNTDLEYLKEITNIDDITIIDESFIAYTAFLRDTRRHFDYIGTRLHGGVHAMQNCRRSIIIAVDNRAIEIAHDTGIPVILESEVDEKLEPMINSKWKTEVKLNTKAIETWRNSFATILKNKM